MGFFKDFKRDFAQAVNELIPEKDELAGEYDDEDMVNTFDEDDNMEIAPEDMLEDIDDYGEDATDNNQPAGGYYGSDDEQESSEDMYEPEAAVPEGDISPDDMKDVPEAELISEHDFNDLSSLNDKENPESHDERTEELQDTTAEFQMDGSRLEDELKAIDNLDEPDMLEGMDDASRMDESAQAEEHYYGNPFEQIGEEKSELHEMDLLRDIENAILKEETETKPDDEAVGETAQEEAGEEQYDDAYAAGALPEADRFREDVMAEVEMNSQVADTTKKLDDVFEVDTTYITKNTTIKGNLSTEGSVDVLGTVKGNVTCTGKLIVGGTIKGDIEAGEIYANAARIEGNVEAEGSVKIGVGSVVVGDVLATSAVVAGAVNGEIDVHGPVIVDSTAVIMGNIKSRSVQINNGAVIEGFCSQCYSEIDVKSFFDMESDDADDEEETQKKNEKLDENDDKSEDGETESENKAEKATVNNSKNGGGRKNNRKSGKNRGNNNNSTENKKSEPEEAVQEEKPAAENNDTTESEETGDEKNPS